MRKVALMILSILLILSACTPQSAISGSTSAASSDTPNDPETAPTETDPKTPVLHPDREKCSVPKSSIEALLTYKVIGDRELKMYFLPPTNRVYELAPVIFMFPGGGLMDCDMFSPYSIYHTELKDIRNAGFATVTIDYRIGGASGEGVDPSEIVSDCMDAIRYISYYSDTLGIDPNKIVTTGHSAGGMLSLLIAYAPHELFDADSYWPEADFNVIGAYALSPSTNYCKGEDGPYDGYYSRTSPDTSLWSTQELRELCSVIRYVDNGGVPCTILMGTDDEWVSAISVEYFQEACDAGGVDCTVFWFKNANHGFTSANGNPVSPDYNTVRAWITKYATQWVEAAG